MPEEMQPHILVVDDEPAVTDLIAYNLHKAHYQVSVAADGRETRVALPFPGRHNVLNALAALAVCDVLGVPLAVSAEALSGAQLPGRRFERVVDRPDLAVISDYAHHPSEIAALVETALARGPGRLLAVFQPHRYTRTLALGADFPRAFSGVDRLLLLHG